MKTIFDFPSDQIIRKELEFVSAGDASEYVDDVPVKSGFVHVLTRIAVENKTTSFDSFRIGTRDDSRFQPAEEQNNPVVGTLYWTADPIYISEHKNLRVELFGCTAGDKVKVYIDGFFRRV